MKKLSPVSFKYNSGQALLIVLLTMSVVLTVVLSVSSRSVVDIATTTYEEDALRAFSAAEAGIEEVLLTQVGTGPTPTPIEPGDPSVTYKSEVTTPSPGDFFNYPTPLSAGESATFWFVSHDANNNLTCSAGDCTDAPNLEICWGNKGDWGDPASYTSDTPAVEVSVHYEDPYTGLAVGSPNNFSNVKVKTYALDKYASGRVPPSSFTDSVSTKCHQSSDYEFSYDIGLSSGLPTSCATTAGCVLMVKVKMFYNSTTPQPLRARVFGGTDLSAQGIQIDSTGVAGESTRKVNVFQSYPEIPSYFDNAIFSQTDLIKS